MDIPVVTKLFDKLKGWAEVLITMLPNFLLAALTMVVAFFLARAFKDVVFRVLRRLSDNEAVTRMLATSSHVAVITLGLFSALEILNLDKMVTSLLAGAGVLGLALGFAFQEIASNFVAGVLIAFNKPYKLGDIIEIDNYLGTVTSIDLRTTSVTTFQGLETIIPNKTMFTRTLVNLTSTPRRRLDLAVSVSYGDHLRHVEEVARTALNDVRGRLHEEPIEIFFKEFGDSSINFVAHIWIEYPGVKNFFKARHDAIIKLKEAFDANGITIPFPIRTLDFGIKGGQKLESSLVNWQKPAIQERLPDQGNQT